MFNNIKDLYNELLKKGLFKDELEIINNNTLLIYKFNYTLSDDCFINILDSLTLISNALIVEMFIEINALKKYKFYEKTYNSIDAYVNDSKKYDNAIKEIIDEFYLDKDLIVKVDKNFIVNTNINPKEFYKITEIFNLNLKHATSDNIKLQVLAYRQSNLKR